MNPADRAHDKKRVVDLDAYRREKFDREAMSMANDEPLTAPNSAGHPAERYFAAQEKQAADSENAKKDQDFSKKFDLDV